MLLQYTQDLDEVCTKFERNLNARFQIQYDYHGELDREEDYADCYEPIKAVSIA